MPDALLAAPRRAANAFLRAQGWGDIAPVPLAADASFRSYWRLGRGGGTAVLMDAPPPQEDVGPFVAVARILRDLGLSAPAIFAADIENGFLLIEDFGDDTYTRLLARGADEWALYNLAVDTLIALQQRAAARPLPELPAYDPDWLLREAALFVEWYVPAITGAGAPAALREDYLDVLKRLLPALSASPTLVLRDFHVDNLMVLPGRCGIEACGILDFQGAAIGPPAYDLVSLLDDVRRDVTVELRAAMTARYLAAFPRTGAASFSRAAAILSVQRNLKILGLFVRLWRRDGKPQYLAHLSRVWRLIEREVRHPALAPLALWLDRHVPSPLRRNPAG